MFNKYAGVTNLPMPCDIDNMPRELSMLENLAYKKQKLQVELADIEKLEALFKENPQLEETLSVLRRVGCY